jgi:hypothetical protein
VLDALSGDGIVLQRRFHDASNECEFFWPSGPQPLLKLFPEVGDLSREAYLDRPAKTRSAPKVCSGAKLGHGAKTGAVTEIRPASEARSAAKVRAGAKVGAATETRTSPRVGKLRPRHVMRERDDQADKKR